MYRHYWLYLLDVHQKFGIRMALFRKIMKETVLHAKKRLMRVGGEQETFLIYAWLLKVIL